MPLKKQSDYIFILGVFCIWTIKFFVRPYLSIPNQFQLFTDIAPNLIGSFLLPFGANSIFKKWFLLETKQELNITCLVGLLLVILNEYIQLIPFFGRTFDYYDILFSIIGVFFGYFLFAYLMRKETERTFPINAV